MRGSGVLDAGGPSAWEGATAALRRSVGFLEASASGSTFDAFGHDYLLCLDGIARRLPSEGPSAALGLQARAAARRLGERWLGRYLELPTDEDAGSLRDRLFGLFALRRVGLSGPRLDRAEAALRAQLEPAGAAIAALLPFDPATEPPPEDAHPLPRGHALAAHANNRFAAWQLALATAHAAETLALAQPAPRMAHVLQWTRGLKGASYQ